MHKKKSSDAEHGRIMTQIMLTGRSNYPKKRKNTMHSIVQLFLKSAKLTIWQTIRPSKTRIVGKRRDNERIQESLEPHDQWRQLHGTLPIRERLLRIVRYPYCILRAHRQGTGIQNTCLAR